MKVNPGICKRCGQYATDIDRCMCREFRAWVSWCDDADGETVYAHDAQDAAEKYAKQIDEGGDYPIITAGDDEIRIKNVNTDEKIIFCVTAWLERGEEKMNEKAAWLDECGQNEFTLETWEVVKRRLSLAQSRVIGMTPLYNLGLLKSEIYIRWAQGNFLLQGGSDAN